MPLLFLLPLHGAGSAPPSRQTKQNSLVSPKSNCTLGVGAGLWFKLVPTQVLPGLHLNILGSFGGMGHVEAAVSMVISLPGEEPRRDITAMNDALGVPSIFMAKTIDVEGILLELFNAVTSPLGNPLKGTSLHCVMFPSVFFQLLHSVWGIEGAR